MFIPAIPPTAPHRTPIMRAVKKHEPKFMLPENMLPITDSSNVYIAPVPAPKNMPLLRKCLPDINPAARVPNAVTMFAEMRIAISENALYVAISDAIKSSTREIM